MKIPRRRQGQSPSHVRSREQEAELAAAFKGRRVRGSGCGNEKGDVRVERLVRIEAKTTKHNSFSLTRSMAQKIENAALPSGEVPVIIVEFQGEPNMELAVVPRWAVLPIIQQQHE
jgi:Holliday junction resolvase